MSNQENPCPMSRLWTVVRSGMGRHFAAWRVVVERFGGLSEMWSNGVRVNRVRIQGCQMTALYLTDTGYSTLPLPDLLELYQQNSDPDCLIGDVVSTFIRAMVRRELIQRVAGILQETKGG